ncbi:putative L-ascorbate peroxidase 6 isoform X2 [Solanum pennellii]|uniref:L-ascorbate peroxidase 6 isoform X2 n=1 Tax=Solanum pennellii TaxID=28526 RepID=A0ABM1HI52_SOLPN|nr:putative L-ascorbate peroxidase 6 isoform X2 [Solanum pennellii]
MSNTVAVDCWLLSSGVSSFTSTSKLYFPANFSRKPRFGSNTIRASATTNGSSEDVIYKALLCGRRALLSMITLPLVMPCERIDNSVGAIAADESFQVREEIRKVLSKGKAAGVLRLVFHDAGTFEIDEKTGGMNGSIVYELDRPENKGLKKSLKILDKAKSQIDLVKSVSWADIIALAGAEAVSLCGGPSIPIQLGRIDSISFSFKLMAFIHLSTRCQKLTMRKPLMVQDPEGKLPEESLDAISLKQCFERKGFSTQELVALSGAHTLGSKGFGNPTVFDNEYFKILMKKPWLSSGGMTSMVGLPSDRALVEDDECVGWISKYAEDQSLFFDDFKNAYTKLVDTGATWKKAL